MRAVMLATVLGAAGGRAPASAQEPTLPRDTISSVVVGPQQTAQVTITYGRPLAAGRTILGQVIPFGVPSMLGAVRTADLRTFTPLQIGGLRIFAGTYALWALATPAGALLIVNRITGTGSAPYDSSAEVGRVRLAWDTLPDPVDEFTIAFRRGRFAPDEVGTIMSRDGTRETMVIHSGIAVSLEIRWDRFRWTVPLMAPDSLKHRP